MLLRPKLRPPPPASTTAAPNAAHVPATIQSTGTTHCPASIDGGTPQCYSMQDHARHAAQMRSASACTAGRQAGLAHEGNAFAGNTRGQTGLGSLSHLMFRGTADIDSSLLSSRKPSRGERRQNTVPPHLQSQIDIGGPRRPNSTRSHDAYAAAARKTSSASYVGRSDPFGSDHPCSSPAAALPAAGIRTNLPVPLSSVIFDGTRGIEERQPTSRSAVLAEEHMRSETVRSDAEPHVTASGTEPPIGAKAAGGNRTREHTWSPGTCLRRPVNNPNMQAMRICTAALEHKSIAKSVIFNETAPPLGEIDPAFDFAMGSRWRQDHDPTSRRMFPSRGRGACAAIAANAHAPLSQHTQQQSQHDVQQEAQHAQQHAQQHAACVAPPSFLDECIERRGGQYRPGTRQVPEAWGDTGSGGVTHGYIPQRYSGERQPFDVGEAVPRGHRLAHGEAGAVQASAHAADSVDAVVFRSDASIPRARLADSACFGGAAGAATDARPATVHPDVARVLRTPLEDAEWVKQHGHVVGAAAGAAHEGRQADDQGLGGSAAAGGGDRGGPACRGAIRDDASECFHRGRGAVPGAKSAATIQSIMYSGGHPEPAPSRWSDAFFANRHQVDKLKNKVDRYYMRKANHAGGQGARSR